MATARTSTTFGGPDAFDSNRAGVGEAGAIDRGAAAGNWDRNQSCCICIVKLESDRLSNSEGLCGSGSKDGDIV